MKGRAELCEDIKQIREIVSEYKVLKLEQIYKVMNNKDERIKKMVLSLMRKNEMIFIHDDMCSSTDNWTKNYDRATVTAFWILLDFWEDVMFNNAASFPAKIEFITPEDNFDIIVVDKGQENLMNSFYCKKHDSDTMHLVAVEDIKQMNKLNFEGIAAFCIVEDGGHIKYYRNEGE